ncbi:MEDS domain-containing protein [Actinocorallia longicatena]|uniref:STAS domain-containing protein n=1 Tax=Actinocorallia longicatena TaxID=111803 RepID=A0ABP6QJK3_9ACTN
MDAPSGPPVRRHVAVGDMRMGDHLGLVYDNDTERRSILVSFVRDGLRDNHKIIYKSDSAEPDALVEWLAADPGAEGLDLAQAVADDQLVVRTAREAYLSTGRFDPDEIIGLSLTELEVALVQGWGGVRLAGEQTFALRGWPGTERFGEFERKICEAFAALAPAPAMAICQFDRRWFRSRPLESLLESHHGLVHVDDVYYDGVLRITPTFTPPGLALAGAVEESTFPALTEALQRLGGETGHLCLDLTDLDFCDMAGLRVMLAARTSPDGQERMVLLRGVGETLAGLLKIAGWDDLPGLVVEEG